MTVSTEQTLRRGTESGMTLAEVLVATAAGTVVLVSALTMLDYGRRVADREDDVLEAGELSRAAVNYVTTLARQAETGTIASNPTNCLNCHVDTDGALANNPATNCPLDMTTPTPPIRMGVFDVDPNNPSVRNAIEPGNGIWFDVDLKTAPSAMNPNTVFAAERRSLFPITDPNDRYLTLQEEEDHDRDTVADDSGPVVYGVGNVRFRLLRATPPAWAVGAQVTPSCSANPAGCHGIGNTNLGGRDIYGIGVWTVLGSPGEVWAYNHPDSQAIRGIEMELTGASRGRNAGGQAQDFTRTLKVVAIPRRLQQ